MSVRRFFEVLVRSYATRAGRESARRATELRRAVAAGDDARVRSLYAQSRQSEAVFRVNALRVVSEWAVDRDVEDLGRMVLEDARQLVADQRVPPGHEVVVSEVRRRCRDLLARHELAHRLGLLQAIRRAVREGAMDVLAARLDELEPLIGGEHDGALAGVLDVVLEGAADATVLERARALRARVTTERGAARSRRRPLP